MSDHNNSPEELTDNEVQEFLQFMRMYNKTDRVMKVMEDISDPKRTEAVIVARSNQGFAGILIHKKFVINPSNGEIAPMKDIIKEYKPGEMAHIPS